MYIYRVLTNREPDNVGLVDSEYSIEEINGRE
jgi:hypothetical protein